MLPAHHSACLFAGVRAAAEPRTAPRCWGRPCVGNSRKGTLSTSCRPSTCFGMRKLETLDQAAHSPALPPGQPGCPPPDLSTQNRACSQRASQRGAELHLVLHSFSEPCLACQQHACQLPWTSWTVRARAPGAVQLTPVTSRTSLSHATATIGLTEEQLEYHNLASQFAAAEFEPHAARWDAEKEFPEEALRKAAELGFGGAWPWLSAARRAGSHGTPCVSMLPRPLRPGRCWGHRLGEAGRRSHHRSTRGWMHQHHCVPHHSQHVRVDGRHVWQ